MKSSIISRLSALEQRAEQSRISAEITNNVDVLPHIAPVYAELHEDIQSGLHSVYNLPGGRGSCKSSFVSLEIVSGIMKDKTGMSSAIVFRRWAAAIRDSVFAQVAWAIDTLGVTSR